MPSIGSAYVLSFRPLGDSRSKDDSPRITVNIAVLTTQGSLIDNIYEGERRMVLSGHRSTKRIVRNTYPSQ